MSRARDLDRVDRAGVDLVEVLRDELVQPRVAVVALVEPRQPRDPLLVARGDAVEVVLHARREVVVDECGRSAARAALVTAKARKVGTSAVPRLTT